MKKRRPRKQCSRLALSRRDAATERRGYLVGVIASRADLRLALRLRQLPDLFELRLDCLSPVLDKIEREIRKLGAPLIITARDPREGGANNLSFEQRRELLSRFLPRAKFLDLELRSAGAFKPLIAKARNRNVRVILSFHQFTSTPLQGSLRAKALRAGTHGADIIKIATRTDNPSELARLINFATDKRVKIAKSAMGIGKLGGISRLLLARGGSVLNYGSVGQSLFEGQLPIDVLRSALPH